MSDVVAISELPEAEMLEALSAKPTDFYLALKDLPNPVAKKLHPVGLVAAVSYTYIVALGLDQAHGRDRVTRG